MIYLGLDSFDKSEKIKKTIIEKQIEKVYVFSPEKMMCDFGIEAEYISYKNIIEYEYFYRLLQDIDSKTLLVVDECLRTQNRNDLTYNCLRHYINQACYIIVFQYLPIIDDINDFMILFDFDTKSEWKREKFSSHIMTKSEIHVKEIDIVFSEEKFIASNCLLGKYEKEKHRLVDNIGLKDPHTIPRNLYLLSGKEKLKAVNGAQKYIARNNRFSMRNITTYKDEIKNGDYVIFELPHNFIDFTNFLFFSRQTNFVIFTTDLKVDQWYFERYTNWLNKLKDVYSKIQQRN